MVIVTNTIVCGKRIARGYAAWRLDRKIVYMMMSGLTFARRSAGEQTKIVHSRVFAHASLSLSLGLQVTPADLDGDIERIR